MRCDRQKRRPHLWGMGIRFDMKSKGSLTMSLQRERNFFFAPEHHPMIIKVFLIMDQGRIKFKVSSEETRIHNLT